jgi:4'-phosphopantetheinyl transferase
MMQNPLDIHWARSNPALPPAGDFLSASEVEKLSKLRFPQRRVEWLLGRWTAKLLLKASVGQLSALALSDWTVANEPDGRPYVSLAGRRLPGCLSISHRGGQALCAWSSNPSVGLGIDLETIEPRTDAFVKDYFTGTEQSLVASGRPDRDKVLIWSAKEAMLKALGTGLRLDTRSVEVLRIADEEIVPGWNGIKVRSLVQPEWCWWVGWQASAETVLTLAVCAEKPQSGLIRVEEVSL